MLTLVTGRQVRVVVACERAVDPPVGSIDLAEAKVTLLTLGGRNCSGRGVAPLSSIWVACRIGESILPSFEPVLASLATVRDESAGALVSTVGEDGGPAAGAVDAGLGEASAVVAVTRQRAADGQYETGVGMHQHL